MRPDENDVIAGNRKIDKSVVTAYENLERTLRELGIEETKPKYTLEPPLGQKPASIQNWNG